MRTIRLIAAISLALCVGQVAAAQEFVVTKDLALELEQQFRPPTAPFLLEDRELQPAYLEAHIQERFTDGAYSGPVGVERLFFPEDDRIYVMIVWNDGYTAYWVVVRSDDGESFELIDSSDALLDLMLWRPGISARSYWVSQPDLDSDGTPEVMLAAGTVGEPQVCYLYRWTGEGLALISPVDDTYTPKVTYPEGVSHWYDSVVKSCKNSIVFADRDHDGVAEIIAYPDLQRGSDGVYEDGTIMWTEVPVSPTRIFKMIDGRYQLWKEIPADEPNPIGVKVPSVIHPGTIPYSALSAPGGGTLRVFVSSPPKPYTLDQVDTESFRYVVNDTKIDFKKQWRDTSYPDETMANDAWGEVPVHRRERSAGQWQVQPSSPAFPSPEGQWELAFVGPYLELRVRRDVVFPFLLARADRYFEENPDAEQVLLAVPIVGDLPDDKAFVATAVVFVKRTGQDQKTPAKP